MTIRDKRDANRSAKNILSAKSKGKKNTKDINNLSILFVLYKKLSKINFIYEVVICI